MPPMPAHMQISELLEQYRPFNSEDEASLQSIKAFIDCNPDCFQRSLLIGHLTASAWILDEHAEKVLLVYHRKLNKWLQPGGHADGQTDLRKAALKEASEETGISGLTPASTGIFDLDVHAIPPFNEVPEHFHYDVRFKFFSPKNAAVRINQEVKEARWFTADEFYALQPERSLCRMAEKTWGDLKD